MTDTTRSTLIQRLKKAVSNPIVMAAIAGVSYFAGLKQNNNSSDPLDGIRDQIGKITHITMVGEKGKFDCKIGGYWVRPGEKARTMRMNLTNGSNETKLAFDFGTNDGILKSSGGISMYVKDGQWVQGTLTTAQEEYLDGKSDDSVSVRAFTRQFDKKTANSSNDTGIKKKVILDSAITKCMRKMKDY